MNLTFANPWILLGLVLVPLMAGWYWWRYRKQNSSIVFPGVSDFQQYGKTLRQRLRHLPFALRVLAVAALVVALARPQSKLSRQEMKVEGIDVVLALDVSGSMLAEDFSPNRLEAAKKVASNFIAGRKDDRMSIVVFSGEAYTQVPLTIDHQVLQNQLMNIKSGIIKDGTAMGDGLATAINRIKDSKAKSKVIILLSDGVNNMGSVDPMSAAEICALYGIRLYTIGIGSRGDAPYPVRDPYTGRVHRQRIPVEIDEALMKQMSSATEDGQYFRSTNKKSLQEIFDQIDKMEKTKIDVTQYQQTKDEYLPFLLLGIFSFALEVLLQLLYFKR